MWAAAFADAVGRFAACVDDATAAARQAHTYRLAAAAADHAAAVLGEPESAADAEYRRATDARTIAEYRLAFTQSARELEECRRELEKCRRELEERTAERDENRRGREATATLIREAIEEVDGPSHIIVPPRNQIRLLIHQRDKARAERDEALSSLRSRSEREERPPEG